MRPIAKMGDIVGSGGTIVTGSPNVFINNIPAAMSGSAVTPHGLHTGVTIIGTGVNIMINNLPAVLMGDVATCGDPVVAVSTVVTQ